MCVAWVEESLPRYLFKHWVNVDRHSQTALHLHSHGLYS